MNLQLCGTTPWQGDRPFTMSQTTQVEARTKRGQTSVPCVGFGQTIPVFEWLKKVSGKLIILNVKDT